LPFYCLLSVRVFLNSIVEWFSAAKKPQQAKKTYGKVIVKELCQLASLFIFFRELRFLELSTASENGACVG